MDSEEDADGKSLTDLVEQPAKVMRIGTMIKQLLEEVRAAPLDDASRNKLREIHQTSIRELEDGLAPELRRGARAADAAVHRGRRPVRRRAADRAGAAGGLAGGAVPRHPDRAVRPADGGPPAAGADAPGGTAARRERARTARRAHGLRDRAVPVILRNSCDSAFRTAHRDAQRVGGVPDLRRQGALAEEGVPRQGGRHDRPQRVQRRRHRGAAGHHHVAGTTATGSDWSDTTARASRRCCGCCRGSTSRRGAWRP